MFAISCISKNLFIRTSAVPMIECVSGFQTSSIMERARQMTRVKKRKVALANKKAKEARLLKNPPPLPHKVQLMLAAKGISLEPQPVREKDVGKSFPKDNVYFIKDYAYKRYTLEEAIENWRVLCSPAMFDDEDTLVHVKIEFDMRASRKDRYLDPFHKMMPIIKTYDRKVPNRNVVCFVPTEELRLEVLQNGAAMAGGTELIKDIQMGRVDIAEIDDYLCHSDLTKDVRVLMALLRDKTPSISNKTIGTDMVRMIQTFCKGMYIHVEKVRPSTGVADEPDYGFCKTTIGRLKMDVEDLNTNLSVILEGFNEEAPKRKDKSGFITRVEVYCKPNDRNNLSKNYNFSLIHPEIYDLRVKEQEKVVQEGRAEIARNVANLKKS